MSIILIRQDFLESLVLVESCVGGEVISLQVAAGVAIIIVLILSSLNRRCSSLRGHWVEGGWGECDI